MLVTNTLVDSTITNIAAPSIGRDIGGGEPLIKWLGASYALAMGVLVVVGGRYEKRCRRCQLCPASVLARRAMVTASAGRLGGAGVPAAGASTKPLPASGKDNEGAR